MPMANETPPDWKPDPLFGPALFGPPDQKSEFELCRDRPTLLPTRQRIEAIWSRLGYLSPENPDQFRKDFQAQFHQRAWELYLLAAVDGAGLKMVKPPASAPDICIELPDGGRCWIEAIAPSYGDDPALFRFPRPLPSSMGYQLWEPPMLLRYTSAFTTKRDKIASYRSQGIVGADDAVIVAIYTGQIDAADEYDVFMPLAAKALFPFGDPQLRVPVQPSNEPVTEVWAERPHVMKREAKIETTDFLKPESAFISGVLYATASVLRLWSDTDAKMLGMIYNPQATVPIRQAILPFRGEMWVGPDGTLEHRGQCASIGYYCYRAA